MHPMMMMVVQWIWVRADTATVTPAGLVAEVESVYGRFWVGAEEQIVSVRIRRATQKVNKTFQINQRCLCLSVEVG